MKLIKSISIWFITNLFLLLFTFAAGVEDYEQLRLLIVIVNLLSLFVFFALSLESLKPHKQAYYSSKRLLVKLTYVSMLFLIVYNSIYLYYTNAFFEIGAVDTMEYHRWATWMIELGLVESIQEFFNRGYPIDDLSAALITSISYRIYPSPLMVNILNLVAGLITVLSIYRLSLNFMDRKFSYLAALSYGMSSFVLYAYSTGLKESVFIMFVVLFFENIIVYFRNRAFNRLALSLFFLVMLYGFRPAVCAMIIVSVFIGFLFQKNRNRYAYALIFFIIILLIYNVEEIMKLVEYYKIVTDAKNITSEQELKLSTFNIVASYLSSAIGPLPSFQPLVGREQQAFYAVGLSFRVFLSIPFWVVLPKVLKDRNGLLVTMSLFVLMEMFILGLILESFELRFSLPHIPFIYILSFYGLYCLNRTKSISLNRFFKLSAVVIIVGMLVLWNARFYI